MVPSLHGPWSLNCCAKGLGLLCLEIVCTLQMMAVHCFKACVAIICFVAVTCHLLPVAIICVLQFVLLGVLPRAILRAPVRAFWCTPSCHFACFSSCFLVGCLVPFCVLQFVLFGVLLRANLCGRLRAVRQSYTRNSKKWRFAGRIVVKFGCFPRAPFCALSCAHCYSQ